MIEIPEKELIALDKACKRKLDSLSTRARRRILRKGAMPMMIAARANVRNADEPVHRYSSGAKVIASVRAPKGKGNIVATYYPGNLEKSIRMLTFRRSPDIFLGPKAFKSNSSGDFGLSEKRVDPYYAHMVHNGTVDTAPNPFMTRAFESTKNVSLAIIQRELKQLIERDTPSLN